MPKHSVSWRTLRKVFAKGQILCFLSGLVKLKKTKNN